MLKHFVEFLYPDFTHSYKGIKERKHEQVIAPDGAFAYRFFDQDPVTGKDMNYSEYTCLYEDCEV